MPIGTSNGDTFETQWDHAMQEFAHMYLKQSLDRPYDGDLPVGNHKQIYNDQPTPEAQRREYNKSAQYNIHDFKNLETNMENTQFFSDQTTNEDLPINGGPKPQNISDTGDSFDPKDPTGILSLPEDWRSFSILKDSAGYEKASLNPEKVEKNPKYAQDLTNPKTQLSKEVIADRVERFGRTYERILKGERVDTQDIVDAINGFLDHVQGIQVIKGMLGFSQNSAPAAQDNKIYLPPNET